MHTTVFLNEAIEALNVQKNKKYIDATFGQGGHSARIKELGGLVLGIDLDNEQIENSAKNINDLKVIYGNFGEIANIAKSENFSPVDGVIFDFGLSMDQIKSGGKGLSYMKDNETLDMRLGQSDRSAIEILNSYSEADLRDVLIKYSENILAPEIAKRIIIARKMRRIEKVYDLKQIIGTVVAEDGRFKKEKIFAPIFQAIRIEVNDEMNNIRRALKGCLEILKPGGVIVAITFHSLEDRLVKNFARENKARITGTRIKVEKYRKLYPFERSAKLRVLKYT